MTRKREFVMLADDYTIQSISGAFISEKLDGIRCLWDGGVSRSLYKDQIPWANLDKDERYVDKQVATGLWTRYGNVIHAPDWFLDQLPNYPLDGELYVEGGNRQILSRIIKANVPDDKDWKKVTYHLFDSPAAVWFAGDGKINCGNMFKKTVKGGMVFWYAQAKERGIETRSATASFSGTQRFLPKLSLGEQIKVHPQTQLPLREEDAVAAMTVFLAEIIGRGGEGIILRTRESHWQPQRSKWLLKHKPKKDSEAKVLGYRWGNVGKEGRLLGRMGSLTLAWNGVIFEMNAGTMAERVMHKDGKVSMPTQWPGEVVSEDYSNPTFPIGSLVTFSYRSVTEAGMPEEAQLLRPYDCS